MADCILEAKRLEALIENWLARRVAAGGITEVFDFGVAIGTSVGSVRTSNEDVAVLVRIPIHGGGSGTLVLALLCDGMGGMVRGGEAARLAVAAVVSRLCEPSSIPIERLLIAAVEVANRAVFNRLAGRGGTTIVGFLAGSDAVYGCSVGDSRIYLDSRQGDVRQVSVDDTIAGELARLRGLAPDEPQLGHFSKDLAQHLGMGDGVEVRGYSFQKDAGRIVMTSDGAHSVPQKVILDIIRNGGSPRSTVTRLIQLATWLGGSDNASVVCLPTEVAKFAGEGQNDVVQISDSFGTLEIPLALSSGSGALASQPLKNEFAKVPEPSNATRAGSKKKGNVADRPKKPPKQASSKNAVTQRGLEIQVDELGAIHDVASNGSVTVSGGQGGERDSSELVFTKQASG